MKILSHITMFCKIYALCAVLTLTSAVSGFLTSRTDVRIDGICTEFSPHNTPSTGKVSIPVFLVDFPDEQFSKRLTDDEVRELLFSADRADSMETFEENGSNHLLTLDGDIYSYTMKNEMSYYKDGSFETLAMEVLSAFDDEVDYQDYDVDGDGYADAFVLTIAGSDDYWYGCQATWWEHPDFALDGVHFANYIINDAQPYKGDEAYFVEVLCHEFGHCMGLPDFYKYDETEDWEGLPGEAGDEIMDDMLGDYSQFSRLMLGYLREKEVAVYHGGDMQVTLRSAQKGGGCLIIPYEEAELYTGEYFLVEYNTPDGNLAGMLEEPGIRIFHIDAHTMEYDGSISFRYNGYSKFYDQSHNGRRIIRLVGDGSYYHAGDLVDSSQEGFAWYDVDGALTVAPGITLSFEEDGENIRCIIREN